MKNRFPVINLWYLKLIQIVVAILFRIYKKILVLKNETKFTNHIVNEKINQSQKFI
jgi:hypothetical protein